MVNMITVNGKERGVYLETIPIRRKRAVSNVIWRTKKYNGTVGGSELSL